MGRARAIIIYRLTRHSLRSSYYNKRAYGASGDPRLAVLPRDLFKERRVLDIGCNEGVVTIAIGAFLLSNHLSRPRLTRDLRVEPVSPIIATDSSL